jgi:multisubunit Na+/H+ antiporter MnhF subunit
MSAAATPRRPANQRRPVRPLAIESATLAVFATLHLTGVLRIGANRSYGAGIAEALICLALACGAFALARSPASGRRVALAALGFAIFGFFVGLSFTVGSGDTIDLAYHVAMLPVLMATAALVAVA